MRFDQNTLSVTVYPNPAKDFIALQTQMADKDYKVELIDELGKIIQTQTLYQGSTMCYFDVQTVYAGIYFLKITDGVNSKSVKVMIE
jgi:hypothetical protein